MAAEHHVNRRRRGLLGIVLGIAVLTAHPARAVDSTVSNSLPNPGARSMGLGGAFVAQADDATAAYANPAGLVQLLRPELMGEIRLWLYSTDDNWFGSSGSGLADITGVSFFSLVYPTGRWSFALYRNELAKVELDDGLQTGLKLRRGAGKLADEALWSVAGFEVVSFGLSAGYQVSEDLSIGLGVAYHEGKLDANVGGVPTTNKDTEWRLSTGILWHPSTTWSVGAFYRQGPQFDFAVPTPGATTSAGSPYGFPDVLGAGAAWRSAGGALTLSGEWDHVSYSSLSGHAGSAELQLEDADELHLAAEYAFLRSRPVWAIRVGAWHDPAHRTVVESSIITHQGEDEMHYAAGFGFAFDRFQMDFAIDISDPVVTISTSGIFKF